MKKPEKIGDSDINHQSPKERAHGFITEFNWDSLNHVAYVRIAGSALDEHTMEAIVNKILDAAKSSNHNGEIGMIADLEGENISVTSIPNVISYLRNSTEGKEYLKRVRAAAVISSSSRVIYMAASILSFTFGIQLKTIPNYENKNQSIGEARDFLSLYAK